MQIYIHQTYLHAYTYTQTHNFLAVCRHAHVPDKNMHTHTHNFRPHEWMTQKSAWIFTHGDLLPGDATPTDFTVPPGRSWKRLERSWPRDHTKRGGLGPGPLRGAPGRDCTQNFSELGQMISGDETWICCWWVLDGFCTGRRWYPLVTLHLPCKGTKYPATGTSKKC